MEDAKWYKTEDDYDPKEDGAIGYCGGELEVGGRGSFSSSVNRPSYRIVRNVARLPHSCDYWVIGGPKEIRSLIADLESALAKMEVKHGKAKKTA